MKKIIVLLALVLAGYTASAQLIRSSALIVTEEELPPVELGWKHIIDGQMGIVRLFSANIHYMLGYRFSEHILAGVGTGYDYIGTDMVESYNLDSDSPHGAVPLYLHGRFYFSTKRWSPYVGVSAGLYLARKSDLYQSQYNYDENGNQDGYSHSELIGTVSSVSSYADLHLGVNHRLDAKNELSLYAGLKFWDAPYYEIGYRDELEDFGEGNIGIYFGTSITF